MPQPTRRQVHVDRPLSALSIALMQDNSERVSDSFFPVVKVDKRSDTYYTYDTGELFRTDAEERAPGTPAVRRGWKISTDTYTCKRYDVAVPIDDETDENADEVLNMYEDAVQVITQDLAIKRDVIWATKYFATGIWTTDDDGVASGPSGTQFLRFDASNSTPIEVIRSRLSTVQALTGKRPNKMLVGRAVFEVLMDHSTILDRLATTGLKVANAQTLAQILDLEEVKVADTLRNTAKEGQTKSMSRVFGKHILLAYVPKAPGKKIASAGYTFSWKKFDKTIPGAGSLAAAVKRWRDENIESDVIEGSMYFDHKVISADLGAFLENCIS